MYGTSKVGSIRPSQLVSTFGPGSIYDSTPDSFLIMGTDKWIVDNCRKLTDETLLSYLKSTAPDRYRSLKGFIIPVSTDDSNKQIAVRTFPTWGVCLECNLLQKRSGASNEFYCKSERCRPAGGAKRRTVPVRFIAACINGHLDDFPWYRWVHTRASDKCSEYNTELYLEDGRESASLESKTVRCGRCGRSRNMAGALSRNGLNRIMPNGCQGKMPWLESHDSRPCRDKNGKPVFMQGIYKGATNVYFPKTVRAITIPPFAGADSARILDVIRDTILTEMPDEQLLSTHIPVMFPHDNPQVVLGIIRQVREYKKRGHHSIHTDEFGELNSKKHPSNGIDEDNFRTEPVDLPDGFSAYLDNLVLVRRLREIATITGFHRIEPFGYTEGDSRRSSPITDLEGKLRWLPASENNGEGIFFSFKDSVTSSWARKEETRARFDRIRQNGQNPALLSEVDNSPKYVFLHTLSHLVIKEIANYAGYSDSSMRERIYSGDGMSGVLIYTSSQGSDGSLGGLVEQGQKSKFNMILQKALKRARLCSMDPLCSSAHTGTGNKANGSACHACLYLPETSCESMNILLDRAFVRSTLSTEIGLFE